MSTKSKPTTYVDGKNFTLGGNIASKISEDNPFRSASPVTKLQTSKDDNLVLMRSLEQKDEKIAELESKLRESESLLRRRPKKKTNRSSKKVNKSQERREEMIQDTLDELELLMDNECDLKEFVTEQPQPKETVLDQCMNETIKEADEKDEEETIFDKDRNRLSSRSIQKEFELEKYINGDIAEMIEINQIDERKYATTSDNGKDMSPKNHNILDYNFSIESESVKFEADLLNDSIKFDDNLF